MVALAREVAAHPGSHWWTAPIDRDRQVLVLNRNEGDAANATATVSVPNAIWEDYAERPEGWRVTSTLRGKYSCLDAVIAADIGDWMLGTPHKRFEAKLATCARVREISGPADWHDFVASYPRINHEREGPVGGGTLVPDWRRVAKDWDGIHLTFLALLTVPFVRYGSQVGTTMMWSWDTEGTIWLPGAPVHAGSRLRDSVDLLDATPFMVGH